MYNIVYHILVTRSNKSTYCALLKNPKSLIMELVEVGVGNSNINKISFKMSLKVMKNIQDVALKKLSKPQRPE